MNFFGFGLSKEGFSVIFYQFPRTLFPVRESRVFHAGGRGGPACGPDGAADAAGPAPVYWVVIESGSAALRLGGGRGGCALCGARRDHRGVPRLRARPGLRPWTLRPLKRPAKLLGGAFRCVSFHFQPKRNAVSRKALFGDFFSREKVTQGVRRDKAPLAGVRCGCG